MKIISLAAAGVALALIAATLAPGAGDNRAAFAIGALICSAVAVLTIAVGWRQQPAHAVVNSPADQLPVANAAAVAPTTTIAPLPAPAPSGAPAPAESVSAEAEVVALLATLQDKGRLVDFLQDEITGYSDAQVGAAARVVHQGCRGVLNEYFRIVPVRPENEGATVSVPSGFAADEYRLVGKIGGSAPFSGTLMHRGWKAEAVHLPRVLRNGADGLPTIAPAEVELR